MRKFKLTADDALFTADTHFGHANIIKFCNRPYADVLEMDEALITNWNSVVDPSQLVFHVGDFAFKGHKRTVPYYLNRLNGTIILIRGNHDHTKELKHFSEVHDLVEVTVDGQMIVLFHYRMDVWNNSHRGSWHLHGHSHGTLPVRWNRKVEDIGVDTWDYGPVRFKHVAAAMVPHEQETVDEYK
jgi:calcineurin-like phosphoesterase family protein